MAPIDWTGCSSNTGLKVVAPSVDFHTPPLAAPTNSVSFPDGSAKPASAAMRPLIAAAPMLRAPRPEIAPESIAVPSAAATAAQPMVPSTRQQSAASSNRMDCSPYPRLTSRSEEHTSELQSRSDLVCRLLLEKKKGSSPGHT